MQTRSRSKPVRSVKQAPDLGTLFMKTAIICVVIGIIGGIIFTYRTNPPPTMPILNTAPTRMVPIDKCEAGERAAYTNGFQAGHDKR